MAEAVGLAASIAGLVGISGQILQGGLFIRQFFEDVRDAPTEIQDLKDELELFTVVASDTQKLFRRAETLRIALAAETLSRTLQRCLIIVDDIGRKLEQYAGQVDVRKRDWWKRIKVASRKKTFAEYLQRLERAKSQLVILQANLTQSFLLYQNQTILDTRTSLDLHHESLSQIATITREIQGDGKRVIRHIERLDSKFESYAPLTATNLSNVVLDALGTQDLKRIPQQSHENEHPQSSPRDLWQPQSSLSSGIHGRALSKRTINFWVLRIDLVSTSRTSKVNHQTKESQNAIRSIDETESIAAQFRIPFFTQRVLTVAFQNSPHTSGFDMQLRTRNIVSGRSPIFYACRTFDLTAVKDMFQLRKASPLDYKAYGDDDISLVDIVLERIAYCHSSQTDDIQRGVALIKFLLPFYQNCSHVISPSSFNGALTLLNSPRDDKAMAPYLEVIRSILRQSDVNPFDSKKSVSHEITLEKSNLGIAKLLIEQQYHPLDICYGTNGVFLENDRQMLADTEGIAMRDAIINGANYKTYKPLSSRDCFPGPSGMHAIINSVANIFEHGHPRSGDLEICCRNRLVSYIQQGHDIQARRTFYYRENTSPNVYDNNPSRLSLVEFSIIRNQERFLRESLTQAGWSQYHIIEVFDKENETGISELFSHSSMIFRGQKESRRLFTEDLVKGKFAHYSEAEIEDVDDESAFILGTGFGAIARVIREANIAFRSKSTPGSWPDKKPVHLLPGIDFDPFVPRLRYPTSINRFNLADWLLSEGEGP